MTRDDKVGVAIGLSIFMAIFLFIYALFAFMDSRPRDCAENLRNTYTYDYRIADLDAIWADKRTTVSECATIDDIYLEAKANQEARATDEAIQILRNGGTLEQPVDMLANTSEEVD